MADQGTTDGTEANAPDATSVVDTPPTQEAPDSGVSIIAGADTGDKTPGKESVEGQPEAGEVTSDGEDKDGENKEAEGVVPETYEFEAPEGMEIDAEMVEKYSPLFKDANLSQEAAQKFVDAHNDILKESAEKQAHDLSEMVSGWKAEFEAIPDAAKVAGTAKRVLDKYAKESDPDTYQFLTETWAGSHPGIVQLFARIGEHVLEDGFDGTSGGAGGGTQDLRAVFPSMKNP